MQTNEFLAVVLPSQGHGFYCAVELTSKRKEHVFVEDIDELARASFYLDRQSKETYFALSTFSSINNRTAANSQSLKCFFADIDCGEGKGYASPKEAVGALGKWCAEFNFPVPYVVASGGGVHCYWPFTHEVDADTWKEHAEAFKHVCILGNLHIDASVTADAARVLRVPGTTYRKRTPHKQVSIRIEGEIHPFETYARLLEPYKQKKTSLAEVKHSVDSVLDSAPSFAVGHSSYITDLASISHSSFERIVEMRDEGCLQIMHYIRNAAQEGMEPLWRGVLSIAKYCDNVEANAKELSDLHPYDAARTSQKLTDIKGPYRCSAFASVSPGTCESCRHHNKISSPITLGAALAAQKPVSVDVQIGSTSVKEEFPEAPKGYKITKVGIGYEQVDAEGRRNIMLVTDTPFYATYTYDRAGERFVQFTYVEHGDAKSAVLPLAVVTAKDDSIKAFAKIGVIVHSGADNYFRSYIKATIAEAKKNPPLPMPTNLGWQPDDTFAFDSRIFSTAGEHPVPMFGFENLNSSIGVKGTLDGWRLVIASVVRLERWDLLSMMCLSFASPLMRFTGLNGLTFHLCGNNSGRGKTLAQRLASSVWGAPDKFRVVPNTSPLAMVNRLGMLGNLPLLVDEITHKGRNEAEWFPEFLSQMSDGRGKDRMESQANVERRNTTSWSSLALMTSNKHMLDYLTAERAHGSEGEIRRLIEIVFDRPFETDELTKSLLYESLPENYGAAGEAYARWLVRNVDTARTVTKNTYAEVAAGFHSTGDERFWIAGCASILASVRLIGNAYAGIIELPFGKIANFLYDCVKHMRVETRRTRRTAMDVLNEFTKRNYGKLVTVNERIARIAGVEVAEVLDRHDLCGRVEKGPEGWVDYFIEERALKAFCSSLSYGYAEFKHDLAKDCPVDYSRRDLLSGTKGPSMSVRCLHVKQKIETATALFNRAANE